MGRSVFEPMKLCLPGHCSSGSTRRPGPPSKLCLHFPVLTRELWGPWSLSSEVSQLLYQPSEPFKEHHN